MSWLDVNGNELTGLPGWLGNLTGLTHLGINGCNLTKVPEWIRGLTGLTDLYLANNKLAEVPEWVGDLAALKELELYSNQLRTLPESIGRLTNLTHLDLDWNQMQEVPELIEELQELTSLFICGNQFTRLPEWLGNLTKLTTLNLADSNLTATPEWLANLTALSKIYLQNNRLAEIPEWFGDLTELTRLWVYGNRLRALPAALDRLTKLTAMDLSRNLLSEVPDWVMHLPSLTELHIGSNRIDSLPEWLGTLVNLQSLSLSNSGLTRFLDWISNLTDLTALHLENNKLTEIPGSIANLKRITELAVGDNMLATLPEEVCQLTRITDLRVRGNQFAQAPSCISKLTKLTRLDLANNKLTEIPEWVGNLTRLRDLYLYRNHITELPSSLACLTRLTRLDVANNQLVELPSWLANLTNLAYLSVGNNKLNGLPSWIGHLRRLSELGIDNCHLAEVPDWLSNLTQLRNLRLSNNELVSLPEVLSAPTSLESLQLENNKLTRLPGWLGSLMELDTLHISGNQLGEVPDSIARLSGLKWLGISNIGLTRLPEWIGTLTALTWLDLSDNSLASLPESIKDLTRLSYFYLHNNKITDLSSWIGDLHGLRRLDLPGNSLIKIPQGIVGLRGLEYLNLSFNEIASIQPELARLTDLKTLNLSNNQLTEIPDWLLDLPSLEELSLAENPKLISPPPEIAASGTESVLAFLRARREGASRQWVSKLLVVGEGSVGKTSLIKALLGTEHDPVEVTTHGIRVTELMVQHPDRTDVQMRLSTWDFGGQQIYHATHQFFLTDRSLFLLLWNSRLGWEQGRLEYWLDIIKSRAPDSPVLLIATHADVNQRPVDLPIDELRREYPQIAGSLVLDNQTRRGVAELRTALARQAADLPLMGAEWPTTWLNAAETVKACPENHITPDQIWHLMSRAGAEDPAQQRYIAVAMHQLGDILYYKDDPELEQTVVLRPEWVNEYISQVLDSKAVDKARGLLTYAEMTRLWSELDRGMRDHFLGMMDKYEISFRVDGGPRGIVSLVVELLPWNPPLYEDSWNEMLTVPGVSQIKVLYQLNTMPPGIPTWFIARSHRFTTNTHWRTGALLQHPDGVHRALIRAQPRRNVVELTVRGPAPAAFFSILDDGFNGTLDRYPGLEIKRLVPCRCEDDCPELFDYDDLQKRLSRNPPRHEIECRKSGDLVDVPQLLLGLAPAERDATRAGIERLNTMLDGIVSKMADQAEYMQRMFLKILRLTQGSQEVRCPSVFAVVPVKSRVTGSRFEIRLYCEEPGSWHPLPAVAGHYQVNEPADWLRKIRPHLSQLLTVLKHAAPLASPVLGMAVGHISERLQAEVDAMTELVNQIPELTRMPDPLDKEGRPDSGPAVHATTEADFRALESLLLKLDPDRAWGGLSRTVTPEGLTLYLCREHADAYRRAVRL